MKTKFGKLFRIGCCLWISVEAQGQTQLKFWLNSSLGAHEKAAYQKAADEYSQKNPNVKVTVEAVPGSETDAAKLFFISGLPGASQFLPGYDAILGLW